MSTPGGFGTGGQNTVVGSKAFTAAGTASANTIVGFQSGSTITNGTGNIILGFQSGAATLTTGTNNILIGISTDTYASNTSNELNIQNVIRGGRVHLTSAQISSCGTGPAISGTASDMAGTITTGTGATACTLQLNQVTGTPPTCLVTARSGTAPAYTTTDNGTTATLQLTTAAASAIYDYWCPVH